MKRFVAPLFNLCFTVFLIAPPSIAQVVCKVDVTPTGAHLGCTEQTKGKKCTKNKPNDGICTGTIECSCVVEESKGGGGIALIVFISLAVGWSALRALMSRPLKA